MPDGSPYGRVLHFGIREHAMGAILNGIALDGLTRPFGGTFLVFSDYMRGAVRLSALMDTAVTYVWTHDSIGLGEDGPTHQPVEHLWALRAIPNLAIVRPADANETAAAWRATLHQRHPVGLVLTRQNVPTLAADAETVRTGVARGAYVVARVRRPAGPAPGHRLGGAARARRRRRAGGRRASAPASSRCRAWSGSTRRSAATATPCSRRRCAPGWPSRRVRPSGWWRYVGDAGRVIGVDHFGASADPAILYREFGLTAEDIVRAARDSIAAAARR